MIDRKDIDRLIAQNGAVIATNTSYPAFDSGARWKKYADGTAEIDIQKTDNFAMTTNTGAGYYTQNADLTITMPITLTHVDIFLCYLFGASWGMFVQGYVPGFPTEIRYRVYRNVSSTVNGTIHFTVKGRWK
jgi:NAD-dependent oxidoreductase involved in siderophore biosynthesis